MREPKATSDSSPSPSDGRRLIPGSPGPPLSDPLSEIMTGSPAAFRPRERGRRSATVGDCDQVSRQNYGAPATSVTHCLSPVPPPPLPTSGHRLLRTGRRRRTHQGHLHCLPSTEGMDDSSPRIRSVAPGLGLNPMAPRYNPKAPAPKTPWVQRRR